MKENISKLGSWSVLFGALYALVGLLGFVPAFVSEPAMPHEGLAVDHNYGLLFGLFPVNTLHNIFHLAIGLWGLAAYRTYSASRTYFKSVAWIYGVLTIMGLIPATNTTFGLIPIMGHDIWLHALTAAAASYLGYAHQMAPETRNPRAV